MEQPEYNFETDPGDKIFNKNIKLTSKFFKDEELGSKDCKYFEIIDNIKKKAKLIFRRSDELSKKSDKICSLIFDQSKFDEIIIIIDFDDLAEKLELSKLEALITKFLEFFKTTKIKTTMSLIIQNCLIEDMDYEPLLREENPIDLNKLEISDELYSFSPYIKTLFKKFKANELILKKFKFNSKSQLLNFADFIINSECKKLTLDDFFIELIIKKDEKDEEYNDLDIYFSLINKFISVNHTMTDINSLTLRDCPMFAIIGDIFSNIPKNKNIDIDQNSLLNPGIITKFKIQDGKYDICFDLDSYKIRLEEEEKMKDYDFIHFLNYIFNIIIPNFNNEKNDNIMEDIDDSGINDISVENFHRLVFKNFDTSKFEYITGDDVTYIDENNWVLNDEEKLRKERFDNFEEMLYNRTHKTYPQVQELVFDNCSNFFIKWVLKIFKGESIVRGDSYHFDLLKIKKCGNGYVDLRTILKMQIKKLILFDTPLIIGENFPEKNEKHLKKELGSMGTVDDLTIKINSLDCYGREYNLDVMKTYEILVEIIECPNYYKNLTFEMNALPSIMTYLAYRTYVKNQNLYNDLNTEERGLDETNSDGPKGQDTQIVYEEDVKYLPKYIFLSSKNYRDLLCSNSFKINLNLNAPLTIKNTTIKKSYENYENQNYLLFKLAQNKNKKMDNKYTTNKELKKIDFGSDGFYIERDYKLFFFENNIEKVKLENVAFSTFKDITLEGKYNRDFETINNLIGSNKFGDSLKKYENLKYPSYIMDMKTFNGIFCVNYGYENVTAFFKQFCKVDYDKEQMKVDITCIRSTFDKLKKNIKELIVIINTIKEQKEFYCLAEFLNFLIQGINDPKNGPLPEKRNIENLLINYFTREKNENEVQVYSDFNYYNMSKLEEKMVKEKKIKIANFVVNIEIKFNYFEEYI